MIELSPDQDHALEVVRQRLASGARTATLAGAAGTGKTTIMRAVLDGLTVPYALAAPTGKAALRIRELTGEPAVTVHRVAYQGADEREDGELAFRRRAAGTVGGASLFDLADEGGGSARQVAAALRSGGRALLVVDEASMVGERLRRDLEDALGPRVQVLAVGDHCQLPPVKADPGYDLERADAKLDKVHRQAEGSPLLALATEIRTTRAPLSRALVERHGLRVLTRDAQAVGLRAARRQREGRDWIALCATNRQRLAINRAARHALGFGPMEHGPATGERVMILDNRYAVPCVNGEIGTVLGLEPWTVGDVEGWYVLLDLGDREATITVPRSAWADTNHRTAGRVDKRTRDSISAIAYSGGLDGLDARRVAAPLAGLAPAYGVTVHKSQGSQWRSGVICMGSSGWMGDDEWRLHYTAATRFEDDAVFVSGVA